MVAYFPALFTGCMSSRPLRGLYIFPRCQLAGYLWFSRALNLTFALYASLGGWGSVNWLFMLCKMFRERMSGEKWNEVAAKHLPVYLMTGLLTLRSDPLSIRNNGNVLSDLRRFFAFAHGWWWIKVWERVFSDWLSYATITTLSLSSHWKLWTLLILALCRTRVT